MEWTNIILAIAGTLITFLLTVIGYFLRRQIKATEILADLVATLNTSVELLKNNQGNFSANCQFRHDVIDKRLHNHSESINRHEKEIGILQSKLK